MVGFTSLLPTPSPSLSIPTPLPFRRHHLLPLPFPVTLKSQPLTYLKPHPLLAFALNNNNNEVREGGEKLENSPTGPNGEDFENNSKQRRTIFSFNWSTLFDPDPDNILALGLTGLLTWASVQVLWQLLFISFAILVAALKYSFIAALLIFILITLL